MSMLEHCPHCLWSPQSVHPFSVIEIKHTFKKGEGTMILFLFNIYKEVCVLNLQMTEILGR